MRPRIIEILSLIIVTGVLAFSISPAFAASFSVTDPGDVGDSNTGDNVCNNGSGFCTLRAAIEQANVSPGADIISFDGVSMIQPASQMLITSEITINGTGVVVDSAGTDRVFELTNATVIINGLTVTGAATNVLGGGFYVSGGSLTLQNGAAVVGNTANTGAGIYATGAQITITGSGTQVSGNTSIGSNAGGLNLQNSSAGFLQNGAEISDNTASNSGGGVFVTSGSSFTVDNATVSGNWTPAAGGILASTGSTLTLQNGAVIRGNYTTSGAGGGVSLSFTPNSVNISNTRFESNTAVGNGDAISLGTNTIPVTITHSCFTNNGDTAISNLGSNLITASGGGNIAQSNWWGTAWGPRITGAGGSSAISNGDSISGNGTNAGSNRVDVGLTDAGDGSSAPTGAWLTTPPTINGVPCQVCSSVSGASYPRSCY